MRSKFFCILISLVITACSQSQQPIDVDQLELEALNGNSDAQFEYAVALYEGNQIPKNNIKSYAWFNVAKANGNRNATKYMNELEEEMTPVLIAQAQEISSELISAPQEARDAQRQSDINAIVNAVYQYAIDNNGNLPIGIPVSTSKEICRSKQEDCSGFVNLEVLIGLYLTDIPYDPLTATERSTRYIIMKDSIGRLTVSAPDAENTIISINR